MTDRPRSILVCPGPDAYGPAWLGALSADHPALRAADAIRTEYGLEPLGELDEAPFDPRRHLRPANAAALAFIVTLVDAERAAEDHRLVGVLANGGGWPAALAVAGALPFEDAFRLAQELALLREDALGAGGGQVIYPLRDADWLPAPDQQAAVADLLADRATERRRVYESIELGSFAVLAGDEAGVAQLIERLPAVSLGGRQFPLRLAAQGPDHSPLADAVADAAADRLRSLAWRRPEHTLVDGRGSRWSPWSTDPAALRDYSLGAQLTGTHRFATALRVALRELAPDMVVVAGPRSSLAGIVGQMVVAEGFHGLRSRSAFEAAQRSGAPVVLTMGGTT
jgi:acyl transferase domain-containing protein